MLSQEKNQLSLDRFIDNILQELQERRCKGSTSPETSLKTIHNKNIKHSENSTYHLLREIAFS
jgi:hypothetical protein